MNSNIAMLLLTYQHEHMDKNPGSIMITMAPGIENPELEVLVTGLGYEKKAMRVSQLACEMFNHQNEIPQQMRYDINSYCSEAVSGTLAVDKVTNLYYNNSVKEYHHDEYEDVLAIMKSNHIIKTI